MKRTAAFIAMLLFGILLRGSARAGERIEPGELEYLGHFYAPLRHETGRFGYGGQAMTYSRERDTLFAAGHVHTRLVAEMTIPEVGGRARLAQPFADSRGRLAGRSEFTATTGPRLDRLGGLAILDGRLWVTWFTYYAVQPWPQLDVATTYSSTLELADARGLYKIGPFGSEEFGQKRTSKYLTTVPIDWTDRYAPGYRLASGKGDGAGSAGNSHGPSLFVVRAEADSGGVLPAIRVLHYPKEEPIARWSPCDDWGGVVWSGGSVIFSGRRGRGESCYGTAEACGDECESGKGYHCQPYESELLFYDAKELGEVANGARSDRLEPYASLDVTPTLRDAPTTGTRCGYSSGDLAFDSMRARIYLWQDNGEEPIIHIWAVRPGAIEPIPPPPEPPPAPFRITVSEDDQPVRFDGSSRAEVLARAIQHLVAELENEAYRR